MYVASQHVKAEHKQVLIIGVHEICLRMQVFHRESCEPNMERLKWLLLLCLSASFLLAKASGSVYMVNLSDNSLFTYLDYLSIIPIVVFVILVLVRIFQ